jgi:hypothetical protein
MKDGNDSHRGDGDLKKQKPQVAEGTIRRAQMAGVEFTTDFVDAVAAGWKQFRDQLNQSNTILDASVVRGSVEAAAAFLEALAKATRKSYDRFQYTSSAPAAAEIDYDKLAKALAAHMPPAKP